MAAVEDVVRLAMAAASRFQFATIKQLVDALVEPCATTLIVKRQLPGTLDEWTARVLGEEVDITPASASDDHLYSLEKDASLSNLLQSVVG